MIAREKRGRGNFPYNTEDEDNKKYIKNVYIFFSYKEALWKNLSFLEIR